MSSSAAINTFRNGDANIQNFTSVQQTVIQLLRDKDGFTLYNFEAGNSACPGILAGSIIGVNYVLYPFDSTELAQYLATDGTISDASLAPDGEYAIIAKPSVVDGIGYCTICVYPYTEWQIVYDQSYGHYIISGTTNRILGGVTKSGSTWSNKWVYQYQNNALEATSSAEPTPIVRMYSDGIDAQFRKIRCRVPGIVSTPISNYTPTSADAAAGYIPTTVTVQYKCMLHVWVKFAASPQWKRAEVGEAPLAEQETSRNYVSLYGDGSVLGIGIERMHTDGSWIPYGPPIKITGFNSTYNNKSVYFSVDPGTYVIVPRAGYVHRNNYDSGGHPLPSWYDAPGISKISVSIMNVQGSTVDY